MHLFSIRTGLKAETEIAVIFIPALINQEILYFTYIRGFIV